MSGRCCRWAKSKNQGFEKKWDGVGGGGVLVKGRKQNTSKYSKYCSILFHISNIITNIIRSRPY